jgi:hypothetical protein
MPIPAVAPDKTWACNMTPKPNKIAWVCKQLAADVTIA